MAAVIISAGIASASQSLVLSPANLRGVASLPNHSAYAAIASWRIEGQADHWAPHNVAAGLWELDSSAKVWLSADNHLVLTGFHGEQISIPLGTITSFRFVGQRDTARGKYSLELWDQQSGAYYKTEANLANASPIDCRSRRFSIGSFYEANVPDIRLGFLRWYSTTRPLGGAPPKMVTSTPGNLLDFEFENNLSDASPQRVNFSFNSGQPSYAVSAAYPPGISLGATPITVRAGSEIMLNGSESFSNSDSAEITCVWSQMAPGPHRAILKDRRSCISRMTPVAFGTYNMRLQVSDNSGLMTTRDFKLGSVATDDNGVVVLPDSRLDTILGQLVRFGANPWSWHDVVNKAAADNQVAMIETTWRDHWNVAAPNGTVSVTYGSNIVTGSNTQFQTDFCGGAGNTTPSSAANRIYIWYPHPDYPSQNGRAGFNIGQCTSQTSLTLTNGGGSPLAFTHAGGPAPTTYSGLTYSVASDTLDAPWRYSNIPANYYDNVLALYSLYYRTGIDTYRDAARTLASRFWTGPNWDMGMNWNYSDLRGGASYTIGGPARGASVVGLILWSLDTGADIWPGIHNIWKNWAYYTGDFQIRAGQIGDIREEGYMIGGLGLCALFDSDPAFRNTFCPNAISYSINNLWLPYRTSDKIWVHTSPQRQFLDSTGNVYVTVTNGSPNITLNGATWSAADFTYSTALDSWLWFVNDSRDIFLRGTSAAQVGDTVAYKVASISDSTHAVLTQPYSGSSGNKGLVSSIFAGFGNQPYMLGLALSALARYVHPALVQHNKTEDAETVRQFVRDGALWLAQNGIGANGAGVYGGRKWINCEPVQTDTYCAPQVVLAGEAGSVFAAAYALTGDPVLKTAGDSLYHNLWGKPGYSAPLPVNGPYLSDLDPEAPGNYMIAKTATSNKWLGFFFGYGFGSTWPASRAGGLAPERRQDVSIPINLSSVLQAARVRISILEPVGRSSDVVCSVSPCTISVDIRQGPHLIKVDYLSEADEVVGPGEWNPIDLKP